MVRAFKFLYRGLRIKIAASETDYFPNPISVGQGVRQGGVLSPYIFNIFWLSVFVHYLQPLSPGGWTCLLWYMLMILSY